MSNIAQDAFTWKMSWLSSVQWHRSGEWRATVSLVKELHMLHDKHRNFRNRLPCYTTSCTKRWPRSGAKDMETRCWDDINDMSTIKKQPDWKAEAMETTTSAYKSVNTAFIFCLVLFGYSCMCDVAWPCPPACPVPPRPWPETQSCTHPVHRL